MPIITEHIIIGTEIKNKGTYRITAPYNFYGDEKDKLLVIDSKYIKDYVAFTFTKNIIDRINEIGDAHKDEEYPYKKSKNELDKISDDILKNMSPVNDPIIDFSIYKYADLHKRKKAILDNIHTKLKYGSDKKLKYDFEYNYNVFGYGDLIVDSNTKRIYIKTNVMGSGHRIGTITPQGKQSNKTYLIPKPLESIQANFSDIVKMLKSLVKKYPQLKDYNYIDDTTTKREITKVSDIVGGKQNSEIVKMNSVKSFILNNETKSIRVYHGTSEFIYRKYISKEGLVPDKGIEYSDKFAGHSDKNVYLTTSIGEARKYAVRASGAKSKSVILEVEIEDYSKITFDEDTIGSILNKIDKKVQDNIIKRIYEFVMSKNIEHTYNYNENLWPFQSTQSYMKEKIEKNELETLYTEMNIRAFVRLANKYKEMKQILNYFGGLALKGSNYTFAYKGVIKPEKIKVKESFKTVDFGDRNFTPNDIRQRYKKVLKTFK
jgi:hypothetical protein